MNPPHYADGNSEFVRTLLACYETYSGKKGEAKAIGGGTYVHHIENGVAFGCEVEGIDNHLHGADEFIGLDVLAMSAKIFALSIAELCK
ncbi:MAG: peptidase M20, partial [Christensenellaceae bacterium]|nr:peptidase M20 [Christensenellaceae bacterium]